MSYFCNIDQSAASFYQFNNQDSQLDLNFNMSRRNLDSPNKSISKNDYMSNQLESSGIFDDFSFYSDPLEEREV